MCGLGLDKVFLYTSDFLMALRESLAEATEWRKGLLGSWLGGLQSVMAGRCGQSGRWSSSRMSSGKSVDSSAGSAATEMGCLIMLPNE